MNYKNIYSSLIEKAKQRVSLEGYFEKHHIIPKSLGGSNSKSNLVNLTAREHFIAHCLLAKIHGGTQWHSLSRFKGNKGSYVNSKLYEFSRAKVSEIVSARFKGVPKSNETKLKMSVSSKGKPKSKEAIENSRKARLGKPVTENALKALHAHRHLAWTPEAQIKKSAKLKGRDVSGWIHKTTEANKGRKPSDKCIDLFVKRITGKKQTPEQIAKRVASRKATLQAQGRTV